MNVRQKIKNIVRRAVITRSGDDTADYHLAQISYNNKVVDAEVINPYGLYSNPPKDLQALMLTICADSENRAMIAYSQQDRFKNLQPGEVVVGNPAKETFIKFDNEGNIEIDSKAKVKITAAAEIDIKCGGDINIDGGDINIVNGTINVTGDAEVNANNVKVNASKVELGTGVGLKPIARLGDAVQVNLGTGTGTITSAGTNESI